tara:strand:- start:567 stop:1268 length:702 start_codon:yes stop_codon:yes gene_type:complete
LKLPVLEEVKFLRRYKRFLADVENSKGEKETVYCPNTGAMTGCDVPDSRAWLSNSNNIQRKYPKTLEFVETPGGIVGVRSIFANNLVEEAILGSVLVGIEDFKLRSSEPKIPGSKGRFDFLYLMQNQLVFIEVKSVSYLVGKDVGMFPDAISARALKHLQSLISMVELGHRAILIFCSQHTGINSVRPAAHVHEDYFRAIKLAAQKGVEIRALGCTNDLIRFTADREIPFKLI